MIYLPTIHEWESTRQPTFSVNQYLSKAKWDHLQPTFSKLHENTKWLLLRAPYPLTIPDSDGLIVRGLTEDSFLWPSSYKNMSKDTQYRLEYKFLSSAWRFILHMNKSLSAHHDNLSWKKFWWASYCILNESRMKNTCLFFFLTKQITEKTLIHEHELGTFREMELDMMKILKNYDFHCIGSPQCFL